jgi:hypothetical protein
VHFSHYDLHTWCAALLQWLRRKPLDVIWHAHSGSALSALTLWRRIKDAIKLRLTGRRATLISVGPALTTIS